MESQSQSTLSPQSPQPQDTNYQQITSNGHCYLNDNFQFESMINPTPSLLSLNGLLQKSTMIKSEDNDNNNGCLPPQFSGFPSPQYHQYQPISVRYPPPQYPHFPPPPNTNSDIIKYQPVMFPAMIPLNTNINNGAMIPLHPPNNVINEDDIFGSKYSPQIMIINQNTMNHPLISTKTNLKKRKRDSNDVDSDEDIDYDNDNVGIRNLITQPISKKRKVNDIEGNGRHFCTYCNKSFVQNCHLSRHIREKHASLKPSFECRICSKSFNQRSNLKVHLRSHALDESVSRPWLCTECYPNRRFTRKSSLKRHWVKKHKSISAQLISELDLSINNNHNKIKKEYIKNESVESFRFDNGVYRIGDIEIPPQVFESSNLPPLLC